MPIHQKTDCAKIDAVGGNYAILIEHGVQGLKHEPVSAEHHNGIGSVERRPVLRRKQFSVGGLRAVRI